MPSLSVQKWADVTAFPALAGSELSTITSFINFALHRTTLIGFLLHRGCAVPQT